MTEFSNRGKDGVNRYTELDSLRGLAAIFVFFSHFVLGTEIHAPFFLSLSNSPVRILWDGGSAVLFFFILSGFVLSFPYQDAERPLPLAAFYFKRLLRIYPAFIIAILLSLALKTWLYNPSGFTTPDTAGNFSPWLKIIWSWDIKDNIAQVWKTFTLIGNYNAGLIDAVIWSLAIEMNISFLIPFLIFIINKNGFLFSLLFIAVLLYVGVNFYVCLFYAGILLARNREAIGQRIAAASTPVKGLLFVAAVLLYTSGTTLHLDPERHWHDYLSAAGSCLFIMLALYSGGFSGFLKNKVCQFLGKISYSLYLIHLPVLITVASVFPYKGSYGLAGVFFISLFCSCAISFIMYKFIEMPFQSLSHRFVKRYKMFDLVKFS